MEVLGTVILFVLKFVFIVLYLIFMGIPHILNCYGNAGIFPIPGCTEANMALVLYGIILGGPLLVGMFAARGSFVESIERILDRIFSWFFSGKYQASDVVKRSSRDIAQEFARVMQAQNYDDIRARQLFPQMGPLRQRMWRARYNERTKEADRLREIVDAQAKARNADSDLGLSVLERERARRR